MTLPRRRVSPMKAAQGANTRPAARFRPAPPAARGSAFSPLRPPPRTPPGAGAQAPGSFGEGPHPLSAADIEAVLVRASRRMAIENHPALSAELLHELIVDFQPPAYPVEIEYQRLIAAFECTSRQLLPPDLAAMGHEKIAERLAALRAAMDAR